jgi:ribosomal-protein-alanine N-acetyltransferase
MSSQLQQQNRKIILKNADEYEIDYIASEIAKIERLTSKHPRPTEFFEERIIEMGNIFMVAEHGQKIVGFMLCKSHLRSAYLTDIAVIPEYRSKGVAKGFIKALTEFFCRKQNWLMEIVAQLRETNWAGQKFLLSHGFIFKKSLRYSSDAEDTFIYVFKNPTFLGQNRCTHYL